MKDELTPAAKDALFGGTPGTAMKFLSERLIGCEHVCSGNCRREGCDCACGEWHCTPEDACRYEGEGNCPNHPERTLRFRAWGGYADDESNKPVRYFVYSNINNVFDDYVKDLEEHVKGGSYAHQKENIIDIQLSTGRFDIRGTEVYEGDFVESLKNMFNPEMGTETHEVVFDKGCFKLGNVYADVALGHYYRPKVVGNNKGNPKLI